MGGGFQSVGDYIAARLGLNPGEDWRAKLTEIVEDDIKESDVFADFHVVSSTKRGSLSTIVVRGERDAVEAAAKAASPQFCEIIPLTLEEIFISEMEERGYDYSEVLF